MTLLPDDTGTASSDWIAVGESTRHQALASNDDGASYVKCNDDGESMIIEYANPSVAESDIDSITSVGWVSYGRAIHRTDPALVDIEFEQPPGVSAYSETASYDAHRASYEAINGTPRTTSDGSNAWTYDDLERMELKCTKNGSVLVYLTYLALKVIYIEAVTDNATFFGANF